MTVGHILERKGYGVETASPGTNLATISTTLKEQYIGAVVITDGKGRLLGIVSERDIVHYLAEKGPEGLQDNAELVMSSRVVTAVESEPVHEIMRLMTEGKFRHVPVTRDGRLVGLVSIGDLVKYRITELEVETEAFRDYIRAA